jgi:LytS/YehU family sensor histidine kinase
MFMVVYGPVFVTVALRYVFLIMKKQKEFHEINSQRLGEELKFLKNQINPHFLFNTLNNLYSLILNNNPVAKQVVLKLSDLLSYMIYESSEPTVSVSKEIEYIENYLLLEKIRYGERVSVSFVKSGDLSKIKIPSLITLPLIENCFKHGVVNESEQAMISIEISYKDDIFTLKTENTIPKIRPEYKNSGMGLKNMRRRLDLIFNGNYSLNINDDNDSYSTKLEFKPVK